MEEGYGVFINRTKKDNDELKYHSFSFSLKTKKEENEILKAFKIQLLQQQLALISQLLGEEFKIHEELKEYCQTKKNKKIDKLWENLEHKKKLEEIKKGL